MIWSCYGRVNTQTFILMGSFPEVSSWSSFRNMILLSPQFFLACEFHQSCVEIWNSFWSLQHVLFGSVQFLSFQLHNLSVKMRQTILHGSSYWCDNFSGFQISLNDMCTRLSFYITMFLAFMNNSAISPVSVCPFRFLLPFKIAFSLWTPNR